MKYKNKRRRRRRPSNQEYLYIDLARYAKQKKERLQREREHLAARLMGAVVTVTIALPYYQAVQYEDIYLPNQYEKRSVICAGKIIEIIHLRSENGLQGIKSL